MTNQSDRNLPRLAMFAVAAVAAVTGMDTYAFTPAGSLSLDGMAPVREYRLGNSTTNLKPRYEAESITSAPAGEDKMYSTDWMCLMYEYVVDNTGVASTLRYTDDGKVYFFDFFSLGKDYWIEGIVTDEGIVIPSHQKVGTDEKYGDICFELSKFVFLPNGNMASDIMRDVDSYTLTLRPDGTLVSPDLDKEWEERLYPVLVSDKDEVFALCGAMTMTPLTDELVTPPAGSTPEEYGFSYMQDNIQFSNVCEVVTDNNDVYVKGLVRFLPDAWLKGSFSEDGTSLVFKSGQYLGHGLYHYYFNGAHRETAPGENGESVTVWKKDPEFTMSVSDGGKAFTFPTDQYFTATIAGDVTFIIYSGKLSPYKMQARVPAKPEIDGIYWMEADFLIFTQPLKDVDGNYIDPSTLSWRMYYDDELFTFSSSDYKNVSSPMTEVPYGFDDDWDFLFRNNVDQAVAIYRSGYKNIGIESVCTVDGVKCVSERAYYGDKPVAIDEVNAAENEAPAEFYDLTGRRVSKPSNGIYLKKTETSKGTKVEKVAM